MVRLWGMLSALALAALALGCARRGPRHDYGHGYAWTTPPQQTPLPAGAYGWFGPPRGGGGVPTRTAATRPEPEPMPERMALPVVSAAPQPGGAAPAPQPAVATFREPLPQFTLAAPAARIASLTAGACLKEVRDRKLPFQRAREHAQAIAGAVRVTGPIAGVTFVTARPPSEFGLMDCRLALTLAELAEVVAPLGVTQVYIGSMFRKNARIARRPKRPSQHSFGLAMDIVSLRLADGRLLSPERDWHAQIGDAPCGPKAVLTNPDDKSVTLRNVVCAVARRQLFHHMLTPSADRAHRDHLHFDIKRDAKYQWLQ
jgi:hypothetical protein